MRLKIATGALIVALGVHATDAAAWGERGHRVIARVAVALLASLVCLWFAPESLARGDAVIYGISPWYHARGHEVTGLAAVTKRLPELAKLGVNVVWLGPIFVPHSLGQGYDVVDYFHVWPEVGNERDLRELVTSAHHLGLKVMLDLPINHTSIHHPWARDVIERGERSPHFTKYQHALRPDEPYGSATHLLSEIEWDGERRVLPRPFVYYFWDQLVNLDFSSERVREFVKTVSRYWVETFDIDGYRFDASWAIAARWPSFYQEVRTSLEALKPDVLLLAEDKAPYPEAYEGTGRPSVFERGFHIAYDWTGDEDWVSRWAWQSGDQHDQTLFNDSRIETRVNALRGALRASLDGVACCSGKVLRYLENNDTTGFRSHHSRRQTELAATLLMTLPGVPLIYYGQEVGTPRAEQWNLPSFDPARSMRDYDKEGFWLLYRRLIELRREVPALHAGTFAEVPLGAGKNSVFAFKRGREAEEVVVVANLSEETRDVELDLLPNALSSQSRESCTVTNLMTAAATTHRCSALRRHRVKVAPESALVLKVTASAL